MTMTETCPFNGTWKSFNWTFSSSAKLKLPVVCSLRSTQINCDSVTLRSSQTKEIHLTHYRMQIIEEKLEEEMVNINKTVFIKSEILSEPHFTPTAPTLLDLLKWPLIGTGAAIILIIILITGIKLIKNHSNSGVSVTIQNSATSSNNSPTCTEATAFQAEPIILPSCPAAAEVQTGPSELHSQDLNDTSSNFEPCF